MKSFIRIVFFVWLSFFMLKTATAEEDKWMNYKENVKVSAILLKHETNKALETITTGGDSYSVFLGLLSEFYHVQEALYQCKDCHSLVVGYVDPDGRKVFPGTAQEQVLDADLRQKYVERLSQNESNWKVSARLLEIKRAIVDKLRTQISHLKEEDRDNAKTIVEHLSA